MSSSCGRFRRSGPFRDYVFGAAPELRDLVSMWQGNTAADVELVVSHLEQFAYHWLNILGERKWEFRLLVHYYQPGLIWEPTADPHDGSAEQRAATLPQIARAKAVAALAGSVFWDNDYVPWDR